AEVASSSSRLAKVARLAECLSRAAPEEVRVAASYLSGALPQGAVGVGWASLRDLPPPATEPTLGLLETDAALARVAAASGPGSQGRRRAELAALFSRATEVEQRFLASLLVGELRQGALEGAMVDAVAVAADVPSAEVRRALMLSGDLGTTAAAALGGGGEALSAMRLTLLRPVRPMLAQAADDLRAAFGRIAPALLEWKLDGARIQAHRAGDDVRVFTRNLADVTARVPEIVSAVRELPLASAILDGEAIALEPDGRPRPFQETMSRFGSRLDLGRLARDLPLSVLFFDALHLDGDDLIDEPARERLRRLDAVVPEPLRLRRVETAELAAAQRFLDEALARGHEGVMVKAPEAPYEAGRRGGAWLKVKVARTLDLVVLAAEWGHGRRRGKLSNLHLGARDPGSGGFVMLGKTFKGLTDEMLAWQTERLLELEERREGNVVHVRPEVVVEVAFDAVQRSPRYPGGVALRFARVKGYRPDKRPAEADTIDTVRALLMGSADAPAASPS
ncbi:MAG: ATP-dependent DNA ligase, partial [Thermoleophilia bacterium]|nr:ATP-dependent DNA ligase [Thermoleophilia bacterium]